jgi:hypothetical protein
LFVFLFVFMTELGGGDCDEGGVRWSGVAMGILVPERILALMG